VTGYGFPDVPAGAHWGWRDRSGQWWEHVPHRGWRRMRLNPYLTLIRPVRPWWRFW
jgi:hypothetical protein